MRFFVYEFVTGGGWWSVDSQHPPGGSLLSEGSSMLRAIVHDFAAVGQVITLLDTRCDVDLPDLEVHPIASASEERSQFFSAVRRSDWTVVIAPEFAGHLLARCSWVTEAGGRLLGPDAEFVRIASDKQWTAERLTQYRVPVPRGCIVSSLQPPPEDMPFPAVMKPRAGAGSHDVRIVQSSSEIHPLLADDGEFRPQEFRPQEFRPQEFRPQEFRLEPFYPGMPASVSVLAGTRHTLVLPAGRQILSCDGRFQYLGGEIPLSGALCHRASRLAYAVLAAMPPGLGYFGIDLILGAAAEGTQDVVIEVNPRLTTSYLGLRQIAHGNLAAAMLALACDSAVELSFSSEAVQFASGERGVAKLPPGT